MCLYHLASYRLSFNYSVMIYVCVGSIRFVVYNGIFSAINIRLVPFKILLQWLLLFANFLPIKQK